MRVLAIETSGRHGSIAVLEGQQQGACLVHETRLTGPQRTAQTLAPTLKDLLATAGWTPESIRLVTVVAGPGSFTGLRIGVTAAKTWAYAVGADVVAVSTLHVLAAQAPPDSTALWAVVDAQRQELFAAKFGDSGTALPTVSHETQVVSVADWLDGLQAGDRVTGPALRRIVLPLPAGVAAVAEDCWEPTAGAAGRVGWAAYQQGRRDDLWQLTPHYYRPSAAEEKAAKAKGGRGKGEGGD